MPLGSFKKYFLWKLSIFDPPPPLSFPIRFTCMPHLNIRSLQWAIPRFKKSSAMLMNFQMKNWGVKKREKI